MKVWNETPLPVEVWAVLFDTINLFIYDAIMTESNFIESVETCVIWLSTIWSLSKSCRWMKKVLGLYQPCVVGCKISKSSYEILSKYEFNKFMCFPLSKKLEDRLEDEELLFVGKRELLQCPACVVFPSFTNKTEKIYKTSLGVDSYPELNSNHISYLLFGRFDGKVERFSKYWRIKMTVADHIGCDELSFEKTYFDKQRFLLDVMEFSEDPDMRDDDIIIQHQVVYDGKDALYYVFEITWGPIHEKYSLHFILKNEKCAHIVQDLSRVLYDMDNLIPELKCVTRIKKLFRVDCMLHFYDISLEKRKKEYSSLKRSLQPVDLDEFFRFDSSEESEVY